MSEATPSPRKPQGRLRLVQAALGIVALLQGCTVGPDFHHPDTPMPAGWVGTVADQAAAQASVATDSPADVSRWWLTFNDQELESLVNRALAANLDVAQAEARIREARAARTIAASGLWPALDAAGSASRSRTVVGTGNLFRAGFDASWEIDVFGGTRRGVEAANTDIRSAEEQRNDTLITLAAEVGTLYLDIRGNQLQLSIARENLATQEESATLTRQRFEAGFVSGLDSANADTQVANTKARIPALESAIRRSIYAMGVLLAEQPATLVDELSSAAPLPGLPPDVPIGLPSELLRRRPDIRRAEADLHSATAKVGVATADLFPRFALVGSAGLQGSDIAALSNFAERFWSIGPSISWPLFRAGAIQAGVEAQEAVTDERFAAYRATVLTALQDVETALTAYAKEQERRGTLVQAVASSQLASQLSKDLYEVGRTDFLNVLLAQRTLLDAQSALADSDTQIRTDLVSLYKAMGGGWDESTAQEQ